MKNKEFESKHCSEELYYAIIGDFVLGGSDEDNIQRFDNLTDLLEVRDILDYGNWHPSIINKIDKIEKIVKPLIAVLKKKVEDNIEF